MTGIPGARPAARSPHNLTRCATAHTAHVSRDVPPSSAGLIIDEGGRGEPGRLARAVGIPPHKRKTARMHASAAGICGADPAGAGCAAHRGIPNVPRVRAQGCRAALLNLKTLPTKSAALCDGFIIVRL